MGKLTTTKLQRAERRAKLPKWTQEWIEALERELAGRTKEVEQLQRIVAGDGTDRSGPCVVINPYHDRPVVWPGNTQVLMQPGSHANSGIRIMRYGYGIQLNSIHTRLLIKPKASNVVNICPEED